MGSKTFNIRISRLVNQQNVRTYIDVEADNEVDALLKVIDLMRKASTTEAREPDSMVVERRRNR